MSAAGPIRTGQYEGSLSGEDPNHRNRIWSARYVQLAPTPFVLGSRFTATRQRETLRPQRPRKVRQARAWRTPGALERTGREVSEVSECGRPAAGVSPKTKGPGGRLWMQPLEVFCEAEGGEVPSARLPSSGQAGHSRSSKLDNLRLAPAVTTRLPRGRLSSELVLTQPWPMMQPGQ